MLPYKTYDATIDNFKDVLKEYGVCVIPNIFTNDECIKLQNDIWNDINYIQQNRFNINDQSTWKYFYDFLPLHAMLIQHHSIAHLQSIWNIRQNELIGDIFAKLWNLTKEDLYTSFDGISLSLPPEITKKGWFLNNEWLHTDQGINKMNCICDSFNHNNDCIINTQYYCIQGLVNLYDVNDGDSTLCILEKSHKYHESFLNHKKHQDKEDWIKISPDDKQYFLDRGCEKICVKAKKGSLILWDSRVFHQGMEVSKYRQNMNYRMAVYICLLPKNRLTNKDKERRKKAFNELRVTNHYGTKLFPKTPRTYGVELKEFNKPNIPILNNYGKSLLGFN